MWMQPVVNWPLKKLLISIYHHTSAIKLTKKTFLLLYKTLLYYFNTFICISQKFIKFTIKYKTFSLTKPEFILNSTKNL